MWDVRRATTVPKGRTVHCVVNENLRKGQEKVGGWHYREEKGCAERQAFRSPNF